MVITREIPRPQWRRLLDDLSRVHAGAAVHLLVLDDACGPETHGDDFRLIGLTADGPPGAEAIAAIMAGRTRVTHIIDRPQSLLLEQLWETRTANVQIVDSGGTRTVISLGPPVVVDAPRRRRSRAAGVALQRAAPRAMAVIAPRRRD
jgi:hypothetical protein